MKEKIEVTNPYSGQSTMLTPEEHSLYHRIKNLEYLANYEDGALKSPLIEKFQKCLSQFSRMNPKAYMVLLD